MRTSRIVARVLAGATLLLSAGLATAGTIQFTIGSTATEPVPGFRGSFLHSAATESTMGGGGYYTTGETVEITGMLVIEFDAANRAVDAWGEVAGANAVPQSYGGNPSVFGTEAWTLTFTGVSTDPLRQYPNGVTELVALDYVLTQNGVEHHSGAFHFADLDFNGAGDPSPNTLSLDSLILWGNNWPNTVGAVLPETPLGVDLYATAATVPEPSALALLTLAAGGAIVRHRRRTR